MPLYIKDTELIFNVVLLKYWQVKKNSQMSLLDPEGPLSEYLSSKL